MDSMTQSTPFMIPFRISTGEAPDCVVARKPSFAMHLARTVAVVVPSPAASLVLLATSWTSFAPMFWDLSSKSIALATGTPSLVIFGAPQLCSITTLRPLEDNHQTIGAKLVQDV